MKNLILVVTLLCVAAFAATKMTGLLIVNSTIDSTSIGTTTPATGVFTGLTGTSIHGTSSVTTPVVALNGQNIVKIDSVTFTGCSVSNSGNICTVTGTWHSGGFPDANYDAACSPIGNAVGRNATHWIDSQTATTITVGIQSVASNAGYNQVSCVGIHR